MWSADGGPQRLPDPSYGPFLRPECVAAQNLRILSSFHSPFQGSALGGPKWRAHFCSQQAGSLGVLGGMRVREGRPNSRKMEKLQKHLRVF